MYGIISESILSPTSVLWVFAAVIAAAILFGSINRRRAHLTDSLREFVDQNKLDSGEPSTPRSKPTAGGDSD